MQQTFWSQLSSIAVRAVHISPVLVHARGVTVVSCLSVCVCVYLLISETVWFLHSKQASVESKQHFIGLKKAKSLLSFRKSWDIFLALSTPMSRAKHSMSLWQLASMHASISYTLRVRTLVPFIINSNSTLISSASNILLWTGFTSQCWSVNSSKLKVGYKIARARAGAFRTLLHSTETLECAEFRKFGSYSTRLFFHLWHWAWVLTAWVWG